MESPRKDDIYFAARDKLKDAFLYSGLFVKKWTESSLHDSENITPQIVERLFAPSVKHEGKVSK